MIGEIDNITLDNIKDGTFVSFIFVAVRAGLKALLEYAISSKN